MNNLDRQVEHRLTSALVAYAETADVSSDAWSSIEARIDQQRRRPARRRLISMAMVGGAAAAVVAMMALGSPESDTQVGGPVEQPLSTSTTVGESEYGSEDFGSTSGGSNVQLPEPSATVAGFSDGNLHREMAQGGIWFSFDGEIHHLSGSFSDSRDVLLTATAAGSSCRRVHALDPELSFDEITAAVAAGDTILTDGYAAIEGVAQPGWLVLRGLDADGAPTCDEPSGFGISLVSPFSRSVIQDFPVWEAPGEVVGFAANPDGSEIVLAVCNDVCIAVTATAESNRITFSGSREVPRTTFGLAFAGTTAIIAATDGTRSWLETLDGTEVLDLGTRQFRSLEPAAAGTRSLLVTQDSSILEVEWASVDDEPAVREYSQPLGPNLTIDAVGYIYDLDERDLPDNSLPDDNVPEAGEEPVRIDPVDAGLERFTLGNGTIGGLSIPLDEEDLRAAFPEHEGWQIVPGTPTGHIQPDQPPETGIGLFRDDVLQLVATDSTVTVLSSDFVTTGGDRVGDTVDELQARHGTVLVQWIEFSGEYARYLGIDPSIGLALKADIAGPEAGLDYSEILHTDQWAHGSYVSSITVSANHAVGYRPPHFEFPEPCPLDEEPDFAEYALDDVDLDGRTERVAIRTCIDSVGQQQHAVLNLSHNPAPFQIPEPFVDISTENGVLTIEFQEFADSDAECCPTLDITEQYEFGPTGLVLTSRVVDG